jgi:hypothetical protein
VTVKAGVVKYIVVFDISVTADEKSLVVEYCHFVTAPVLPFRVKAFVPPEQIAPAPEMVPATEVGLIVVAEEEAAV